MTRINVVTPRILADQHLMAEYRELPMVMAALRRSKNSKAGVKGIPQAYTMGAGHVKFFYDKGKFLRQRYSMLIDELVLRGYHISPESRDVAWDVFDESLNNMWEPNSLDMVTNLDRILVRLEERFDFYRYFSNQIDDRFMSSLITLKKVLEEDANNLRQLPKGRDTQISSGRDSS